MATDYKSIFSSKTFWGAVIMLLSFFIPKLTDVGAQAAWVDQITMMAGFVLAIVGRFTAKKPVTLTGGPPITK
jgi:archaellum biogenesis protein FlaJ (TadC family)